MKHWILASVIAVMASSLSPARAQPLADIAPSGTILSLGLASYDEFYANDLLSDIASLDWEQAIATATQLVEYVAANDSSGDFDDFGSMFEEIEVAIGEAVAVCPGLEPFFNNGLPIVGDESLLTVSMSPFSPMPAITALSRFSGDMAGSASELQAVLVGCAEAEMGELPTLQEGDTTLVVLGDGGDLPLIVGSVDNLFIIGTEPETTRSVVRLSTGSDEASMASSRLSQLISENFASGGLSLSLDLQALADIAENFGGMFASQPEEQLAVERAIAMLRTLGGVAGNVRNTEDGLLSESLVAVDPEGGDDELASILLCEDCAVSTPDLFPDWSIAVSSQYNYLPAFFDYTQTWVDAFEPYIGTFDMVAFVDGMLGINLDTALFDWMGDSVHNVVFEPISSELSTLIYNPAAATLIPVSSPEAAEAGLTELGELVPLLVEALTMLPDFDDAEEVFGTIYSDVVVDTFDYEGYEIERYRFGPTTNIGLTFVDDHLVIASPAEVAITIIDTFNGDYDGISANPDFRAAEAASADNSVAFVYSDSATQLEASADLLSLFTQPSAFVISAGLTALELESMGMGPMSFDSFSEQLVDLDTVTATPLSLPADAAGTVSSSDGGFEMTFDSFSEQSEDLSAMISEVLTLGGEAAGTLETGGAAYYVLEGINPGDDVTVTLNSNDFDTYLYVIDRDSQTYLFENDDNPDTTTSEIEFTAQEGVTYWLEVAAFGDFGSGAFTVSANSTMTDMAMSDDAPTSVYYALEGLTPGDEITVTMTSDEFDTQLYIIDRDTQEYVFENDDNFDAGSMSAFISELTFTVEPGVTYWVEATSFAGFGSGAFDLSVMSSSDMMMEEMPMVEPPSFGQLLQLAEMGPEILYILADYITYGEGYSEILPGEGIYVYRLLNINW